MANTQLSVLRSGTRSEIKIDRLGKIWSDSEVDEAIDMGIQEIELKGNYRFPQNQTDVTFDSVIGDMEYDMETLIPNYQGMQLIQYADRTLTPTTLDKLKRDYREFVQGTPTHYYVYNGKLGLHPYPATVKTLDISYTRFLLAPTSNSDESPFPKAFDKAIKLYAAYTLLMQPGDQKNQMRAKSKLVRFRMEMGKLYNGYLIPDRENIGYKTSYVPRQSRSRISNPHNL